MSKSIDIYWVELDFSNEVLFGGIRVNLQSCHQGLVHMGKPPRAWLVSQQQKMLFM
jgi:hypothetical protein